MVTSQVLLISSNLVLWVSIVYLNYQCLHLIKKQNLEVPFSYIFISALFILIPIVLIVINSLANNVLMLSVLCSLAYLNISHLLFSILKKITTYPNQEM